MSEVPAVDDTVRKSLGRTTASQKSTHSVPIAPTARNGARRAAGPGEQAQEQDRRDNRADRGPALQDAVTERPLRRREDLLRRLQRKGQLPASASPSRNRHRSRAANVCASPVANPANDHASTAAG